MSSPAAVAAAVPAHLGGRGFVEPIDDFRHSNPTVMPALLDDPHPAVRAQAAEWAGSQGDDAVIAHLVLHTNGREAAVALAAGPRLPSRMKELGTPPALADAVVDRVAPERSPFIAIDTSVRVEAAPSA